MSETGFGRPKSEKKAEQDSRAKDQFGTNHNNKKKRARQIMEAMGCSYQGALNIMRKDREMVLNDEQEQAGKETGK